MLFRLPDSPTDAKFLTEEERMIAIERMRANQTGYKTSEIDRYQIVEAFTDIKTWLLASLILACNIPNGGFTTVSEYPQSIYFYRLITNIFQFNGLVLQGFGFNTFHTLLLGLPGGFIVFLFVLLG